MKTCATVNRLITQCMDFFSGLDIPCAICAGYALDLFTNTEIRPRSDIDVLLFENDKQKCLQYVFDQGWELYENLGKGVFRYIGNPNDQIAERFSIQAVKPGCSFINFEETDDGSYKLVLKKNEQTEFDYIDMMFNPREGSRLLYAQNPAISRELDKAMLFTPDGIPYICPEFVLFCKSTTIDRKGYQLEFDVTLPLLSEEARNWLINALETAYPDGHKWSELLKKE